MKEISAAMVLSGCGVLDGTEIHEAAIAILNLQKLGVKISFFAPDMDQAQVVNHITGAVSDEVRSVLAESARIARGRVDSLSSFNAEDFDFLVFPGGFGAAKNLSTFAFDSLEMKVEPSVEHAVVSALKANLAIAFICISPVIGAKVIGGGVNLTIGRDPQTAAAIEHFGAKHIECAADGFVKDAKFKVYSTPAYMLAKNTAEIDAAFSAMFSDMAASA